MEEEREARASVETDLQLTSMCMDTHTHRHTHSFSLSLPPSPCVPLPTSLPPSEKQLNSTLEELKEREDLISELRQPPPDVPGADRQELLRLLDRR